MGYYCELLANSNVCTQNSWGTPGGTRGPVSSGLSWWQHEAPQRRTGLKVLQESLRDGLLLGGVTASAASGQPCHFCVFQVFRDVVSTAFHLGLSEGCGALLVKVVSPVRKGQHHLRPQKLSCDRERCPSEAEISPCTAFPTATSWKKGFPNPLQFLGRGLAGFVREKSTTWARVALCSRPRWKRCSVSAALPLTRFVVLYRSSLWKIMRLL